MLRITKFLTERPLITNLIIIFIIISAVFSILNIKRQAYPRVDFQQLFITTEYPGASPEDVELNVTVKLEEALKELDGIDKYSSISLENYSIITVDIDPDYSDKKEVKDEIRRVIGNVIDLPPEVEKKPKIIDHKVDHMPVYEVALSMKNYNEKELTFHAKQLKKKILDIKDVANIRETGVSGREIKIILEKNKMKDMAVTFDEVIQAVKLNKIRLSGGTIESYTSEKGIVTFSEFEKPEDIENIIVRAGSYGGRYLRIKDVGKVVDGFEKKSVIYKFNGKMGLSLWVVKKTKADVIKTVNQVKNVVEDYKKNLKASDIVFSSTWDASLETKSRLNNVYINAFIGFLLVIIVLFLFLDKRVAFWTAFGIPVSIAVTITLLPLLNITINSISLLGLIVVLGMVVDDAIIIAENIYIKREMGLDPNVSSIEGLREVIKPVFSTIITTQIAFMPLYFIPGISGDFAVEVPSIVIIMLTASFLEACLMLPAHLAHAKKDLSHVKHQPPGQYFINGLNRLYEKILKKALNHSYKTSFFLILFLIVGLLISLKITKFDMFPLDQAYQIWITGETSRNSNLDFTFNEVKKLEEIVEQLPHNALYSYKTEIGKKFSMDYSLDVSSSNYFTIQVNLVPASKRKISALKIQDFIKEEIKKRNINSISNLDFFIDSGGPPLGKPLEIRVTGNNNIKRENVINDITKELKKYPVTEINTDLKEGKDEIRIIPKYENLAVSKINAAAIASAIRIAYDGAVVANLQTPEEKIPFRVMLDEMPSDFIDPLKDMNVLSPRGNIIPIKSLVYEKQSKSIQGIYHYNSERTNVITANVDIKKTSLDEVYKQLSEKYKNFEKNNEGMKLIIGGEAKESFQTRINLILALLIAIIAIYFILVIQFNSFFQPVMVILSIPFGLIGITLAFGVHGLNLSMLSMVGIIGFTGVVVNDSLIMVHFMNQIKKEKPSIKKSEFIETIIKGAKLRLRPIILTSLTTIVALIPTAYGIFNTYDYFISPMVLAMLWGLLIGTLANLIIIPVLYYFYHNLIGFMKKLINRK